jgi:hypothetical protein
MLCQCLKPFPLLIGVERNKLLCLFFASILLTSLIFVSKDGAYLRVAPYSVNRLLALPANNPEYTCKEQILQGPPGGIRLFTAVIFAVS